MDIIIEGKRLLTKKDFVPGRCYKSTDSYGDVYFVTKDDSTGAVYINVLDDNRCIPIERFGCERECFEVKAKVVVDA